MQPDNSTLSYICVAIMFLVATHLQKICNAKRTRAIAFSISLLDEDIKVSMNMSIDGLEVYTDMHNEWEHVHEHFLQLS